MRQGWIRVVIRGIRAAMQVNAVRRRLACSRADRAGVLRVKIGRQQFPGALVPPRVALVPPRVALVPPRVALVSQGVTLVSPAVALVSPSVALVTARAAVAPPQVGLASATIAVVSRVIVLVRSFRTRARSLVDIGSAS